MGSVVRVSPSNFVSTMILCRGRLGNLRPECITKFSHNKHLTNLKYGQFNPEVRRKLKDFLTNLPSRTETTTKIPSLSPIYTRLKLPVRYSLAICGSNTLKTTQRWIHKIPPFFKNFWFLRCVSNCMRPLLLFPISARLGKTSPLSLISSDYFFKSQSNRKEWIQLNTFTSTQVPLYNIFWLVFQLSRNFS